MRVEKSKKAKKGGKILQGVPRRNRGQINIPPVLQDSKHLNFNSSEDKR